MCNQHFIVVVAKAQFNLLFALSLNIHVYCMRRSHLNANVHALVGSWIISAVKLLLSLSLQHSTLTMKVRMSQISPKQRTVHVTRSLLSVCLHPACYSALTWQPQEQNNSFGSIICIGPSACFWINKYRFDMCAGCFSLAHQYSIILSCNTFFSMQMQGKESVRCSASNSEFF
jgi:hypothetical protein